MKLKLKKGDTVKVISGASVGQQGEILEINKKGDRVTIEGLTQMTKKHVKPQSDKNNPDGGIIEMNKTIHISNVMLVDPSTKQTTRIGRKVVDGKMVRFAKKSGEVIS